MTSPIAIEMPLRLEPVIRDPFIDGLEQLPPQLPWPLTPSVSGTARAERTPA